ncbi:protein NLRC3-like isoform X2 [Anabas testudineus]|uniref:NACHT domain-containing protein n=1 Tax=Anabas testudineus TaxID=64144 RepID=A0AAQ6IJM8_ANATE|nr:protein NLRC3-like isoform X2 [Anabas testudineus]
MRSQRSMGEPVCFSNESKCSFQSWRADSVLSRDGSAVCCSSVFRKEAASFTKERKKHRGGVEEELQSCCCQGSVSVQTSSKTNTVENPGLQEILHGHKMSLKRRCDCVTEGFGETRSRTKKIYLKRMYTELDVREGQSEETPVKCRDIFKVLLDQEKRVRVVLINGIAGIGKTVLVQKFTLDWADGSENQGVCLVILLSFRELNLVRDEQHSLLTLLRVFYPTLQKVTAEQLAVCKLLFIFDGLDENRLSLDFNKREIVSDVTQMSSVNVLLINLIKGNLLPSALVWITSRPAAASQIPPTCVDRVTEVRGFTDAQKEEYFRRRFRDEELSSRIISHVKTSRSLHIMCFIPIFCLIIATVLEHMLTTNMTEEIPLTLTNMYSHLLMVLTKRKKYKYNGGHMMSPQELTEVNREVLLKLGRLAFEHLEKGNTFSTEDLEQCGLDVTEASVYSGVCTEIFKRESVIFQKAVYCFVHRSVQEFLAAVYVFHCYTNKDFETLESFLGNCSRSDPPLEMFLRRATEESMKSMKGHLDLFVRFLHGLSLESNQRLLAGLLGQMVERTESIHKSIHNLKEMSSSNISPNRRIIIFHCLMEINDHCILRNYVRSENRSETKLPETHCSDLAFVLQISEDILDMMEMKAYRTSKEGRFRLMPAVRNCREVLHFLASTLKLNPFHLREPE